MTSQVASHGHPDGSVAHNVFDDTNFQSQADFDGFHDQSDGEDGNMLGDSTFPFGGYDAFSTNGYNARWVSLLPISSIDPAQSCLEL